jgi:hypothetical protein
MATRPNTYIVHGYIRPYTVASGQTVTLGKTVKFGSTDNEIQDAGANSDLAIGVARKSGVAGDVVEVVHPFTVVVPMLVGTGGTTRGAKQKVVSDGITDADTNGGGTTSIISEGIALQSGVIGDLVSVGLVPAARVKT